MGLFQSLEARELPNECDSEEVSNSSYADESLYFSCVSVSLPGQEANRNDPRLISEQDESMSCEDSFDWMVSEYDRLTAKVCVDNEHHTKEEPATAERVHGILKPLRPSRKAASAPLPDDFEEEFSEDSFDMDDLAEGPVNNTRCPDVQSLQ